MVEQCDSKSSFDRVDELCNIRQKPLLPLLSLPMQDTVDESPCDGKLQ